MKIKSCQYRIMWSRLSVFRHVEYEPAYSAVFECEVLAGYSERVFTLWPKWLWLKIKELK